MSKKLNVYIPAGYVASFTSDALTSGTYVRLPNPGGTRNTPSTFAVSTSVTIGPFNNPYNYEFDYNGSDLSVTVSNNLVIEGITSTATELNYTDGVTSAIQTQIDAKAPTSVSSNVGTAATNVSAAEYGDAYQHTTVLTVTNAVLPSITGGANQAVGVLLYTLPAGACVVKQAYMSLAIQQQDGNITADTPDVGLGTTQGSGSFALLSDAGPAYENIITGQLANDCDGTAEVKTIADQVLVVESGGDHTIYFNAADLWAASGDTGALVSGTVVLHWQFMI